MQKSIMQFLPKLGFALFVCFRLLDTFLITKGHFSNVGRSTHILVQKLHGIVAIRIILNFAVLFFQYQLTSNQINYNCHLSL